VTGAVELAEYAPGSKSEHQAVELREPSGTRWVLRRPGADPFADPELRALAGRVVTVTGREHGHVLFVDRWEEQPLRAAGSPPPRRGAPAGPPPS
jgi:hypothetical protein